MHEKSITFPLSESEWINTPGVFEGRDISEDEAMELYKLGKLQRFGPIFPNLEQAERAAQIRSMMFNEQEQLTGRGVIPDILKTIHWPYR